MSTSLPRVFSKHPKAASEDILYEGDLKPHRYARLRAKLLIFKSFKAMQKFASVVMNKPVGKKCQGCVLNLSHQVEELKNGEWRPKHMNVDKNYFCVILLVQGHLTTTIVSHECVHAGFSYAKRLGARSPFAKLFELDQEYSSIKSVTSSLSIISKHFRQRRIGKDMKITNPLTEAVLKAGWSFSEIKTVDDPFQPRKISTCIFTCVCGKYEKAVIKGENDLNGMVKALYQKGSFFLQPPS